MSYESYDEEFYFSQECGDCEVLDSKLNEASNWFDALVEMAYSKHNLDESELERCLEHLGHYLGRSVPQETLQLSRKFKSETKITSILEEWKEVNKTYLKNLI